jgi:hypothetical protein
MRCLGLLVIVVAAGLAAAAPAERPFLAPPPLEDEDFLGWYDPTLLGGRMLDVRALLPSGAHAHHLRSSRSRTRASR